MPIPSDSLPPDAAHPKGCTTFSSSATVKEKVFEACGNILYSNYNPKPHHVFMAVLGHKFIQTLKIATIFTAARIIKTQRQKLNIQAEDQKSKTVNSIE